MTDPHAETADDETFDQAFEKAVHLGNRLSGDEQTTDAWDVADGLLAGAIQYWLYSRQPCGDVKCEDCAEVSTAEQRMAELKRLMQEFAEESEYYHTPYDSNVGRA